jgi:hypothetical protein
LRFVLLAITQVLFQIKIFLDLESNLKTLLSRTNLILNMASTKLAGMW